MSDEERNLLKEYETLAEQPKILHSRDIPVSEYLVFIRVRADREDVKIIFLETGSYFRIPQRWILFFGGLGEWAEGRLEKGSFLEKMSTLCYGILKTSIVSFDAVLSLFTINTEEFRKEYPDFEEIEYVTVKGFSKI